MLKYENDHRLKHGIRTITCKSTLMHPDIRLCFTHWHAEVQPINNNSSFPWMHSACCMKTRPHKSYPLGHSTFQELPFSQHSQIYRTGKKTQFPGCIPMYLSSSCCSKACKKLTKPMSAIVNISEFVHKKPNICQTHSYFAIKLFLHSLQFALQCIHLWLLVGDRSRLVLCQLLCTQEHRISCTIETNIGRDTVHSQCTTQLLNES